MNPLLDKDFLIKLDEQINKEVYVRLITMTYDEEPLEQIEGVATGGSINIDGTSAVRRTCSISLVTKELNINQFYWGLNNKFKVEVGLLNLIDTRYPDIIWFPQGTYIITSFNINYTTNNFTISISGKDKMCLLNGDIGGSLTASIDFGVDEYVNHIPIKDIVREAVHTYAREPYHNIIINDLDETAVELLEYRGDTPLYLLYNEIAGVYENYILNGDTVCWIINDKEEIIKKTTLANIVNDGGSYDSRVELAPNGSRGSSIVFDSNKFPIYRIAKITYGQTVGYRATDLIYAGELISNTGDSLTSILDKIIQMLGNYEYFYDLEGRFTFQRKKTYLQTSWNNIKKVGDEEYADSAAYTSSTIYNFTDNKLITSFSNQPNLTNLKNDYSIWGMRKSVSGTDIPIHYRYAIDKKPKAYRKITVTEDDISGYNADHPETPMKPTEWEEIGNAQVYLSKDYDWRELIYQMALDYYAYNQLENFTAKIIEANKDYADETGSYLDGTTGYEQYYIDMQGFWRQLYDPQYNDHPEYILHKDEINNEFSLEEEKPLYTLGHYVKVNEEDVIDRNQVFTLWKNPETNKYELQPLLNVYPIDFEGSFKTDEDGNYLPSDTFYIANINGTFSPVAYEKKQWIEKGELYIKNPNKNETDTREYILLIDSISSVDYPFYIYKDKEEKDSIDIDLMIDVTTETDIKLQSLYYDRESKKYQKYLIRSYLDISGTKIIESSVPEQIKINYYEKDDKFISNTDNSEKYGEYKNWNKMIIDEPSSLNFWFDFLDAESELGKYSVSMIGDRTKVINDNTITAIYFREVPNLIFTTYEDYKKNNLKFMSSYLPVFIQSNLESLFNISSQGKSAKDELDQLLYNYSYCIENITIQALPIYYLTPNTRIFISDNESQINGDYIVSKISLPLTYNGTMSITATKAPKRLL